MRISDFACNAIKNHIRVKAHLMLEFNKTHKTIDAWILRKDIALTTKAAIKIIQRETGLTEKQILTDSNTQS